MNIPPLVENPNGIGFQMFIKSDDQNKLVQNVEPAEADKRYTDWFTANRIKKDEAEVYDWALLEILRTVPFERLREFPLLEEILRTNIWDKEFGNKKRAEKHKLLKLDFIPTPSETIKPTLQKNQKGENMNIPTFVENQNGIGFQMFIKSDYPNKLVQNTEHALDISLLFNELQDYHFINSYDVIVSPDKIESSEKVWIEDAENHQRKKNFEFTLIPRELGSAKFNVILTKGTSVVKTYPLEFQIIPA